MKLVPVFLLFTSFIFAQTKPYYYPVATSLGDHHIMALEEDAFGRLIVGISLRPHFDLHACAAQRLCNILPNRLTEVF